MLPIAAGNQSTNLALARQTDFFKNARKALNKDDFTRHYIIRYLSARELVLPPCFEARRNCEGVDG